MVCEEVKPPHAFNLFQNPYYVTQRVFTIKLPADRAFLKMMKVNKKEISIFRGLLKTQGPLSQKTEKYKEV